MASRTWTMREVRSSASGLLASGRARVSMNLSYIQTQCGRLTPEVCNGEDEVSLEPSPCSTPCSSTFGKFDPLSEYLERAWGEPTPDHSPVYSSSTNSLVWQKCKPFLLTNESTQDQHAPLGFGSLSTRDEGAQAQMRQARSPHTLSYLPTLLSTRPEVPSKLDPFHFVSSTTSGSDDTDHEDAVALEAVPFGHTRQLSQSCASQCESNSNVQINDSVASSDGDWEVALRQGQHAFEIEFSEVLLRRYGVGLTIDESDEIRRIFDHFYELMITAVNDVVSKRVSAVSADPPYECTSLTDSEPPTSAVEDSGLLFPGFDKDAGSLTTNGISTNINVCYHWRNKGSCSYSGSCKFLHPNEKKGVGKARAKSKKQGVSGSLLTQKT